MLTSSHLHGQRFLRVIAGTTLFFFLPFCLGCSQWRPVSITREIVDPETSPEASVIGVGERFDPVDLMGKRVRFHTNTGTVDIKVTEVDFPYARGYAGEESLGNAKRHKFIEEVDLRGVSHIEVEENHTWLAFTVLVLFVPTIALIIYLGIVASGDPVF